MEDTKVDADNEILQELTKFLDQVDSTSSSPSLEDRQRLWTNASKLLEQRQHLLEALKVIKCLSREKSGLESLVNSGVIQELWKCALGLNDEEVAKEEQQKPSIEEVKEAQRCLNNLLLQSSSAREATATETDSFWPLKALVEAATAKAIGDDDVAMVNLKLLFLITALCPQTRKRAREELGALGRFNAFLSAILEKNNKDVGSDILSESNAKLISETLKVLFNLCLDAEDKEEEQKQLCSHLQNLILLKTESETTKEDLLTNCIHLLTTQSNPEFTAKLFDTSTLPKNVEAKLYEEEAMNVADVIFERLKNNLDQGKGTHHESMSPLLCTLSSLCRNHRLMRKHLKTEVLPPLKDVKTRPEEGETVRNKLCKLLTSPVHAISCLVADFLFVLCKENVARMVKHTGYGNAAGLLARRGLMLGDQKKGNNDNYSDDDDDEASDTEEYMLNAHRVNPIVGCVEPDRPSALDSMTDEQKEHEAMKLVGLINDLNNMGIVRPAVPGPDGRPQQIEHILQLRDAAVSNNNEEDKDEDEDDERAGR